VVVRGGVDEPDPLFGSRDLNAIAVGEFDNIITVTGEAGVI
tara:strand:- start:77 stop:199 length:123 start_codon:yes stop_codon:yes gene_type:complete